MFLSSLSKAGQELGMRTAAVHFSQALGGVTTSLTDPDLTVYVDADPGPDANFI